MFALPTRFGGWPAVPVRTNAIHPLGDDARCGGFASAANARHHKGLRNTACLKRVLEGAHHRVLTDKISKGFGAVFSRKDLVAVL